MKLKMVAYHSFTSGRAFVVLFKSMFEENRHVELFAKMVHQNSCT
jgi:hypothetical protein